MISRPNRIGGSAMRSSFPRLGSGRGADTTAPVASSVSYDTGTDTLTLAVSEACTLYAMHNASSTPLSAATIQSGAEVTQALAAGIGYITWDDSAWAAGTWYLHICLVDGAGNATVLTPTEHVIAAAGPFGVDFDGTNDWLHTSGMSAPAASKQGALALVFQIPTNWPNGPYMASFRRTTQPRVAVQVSRDSSGGPPTTQGRLSLTLRNSGGSSVGSLTFANGTFLIDTWYTVLISWNSATQTWVTRIRANAGAWVTPSYTGAPSLTLDALIDTTPDAVIGAIDSAGVSLMTQWYCSRVWFAPGQLPDFTNAAVRDAFLPTASWGGDGSTPTGVAPLVFLDGPTVDWHTNKGSGTGLTEVGALTDAPSVPA